MIYIINTHKTVYLRHIAFTTLLSCDGCIKQWEQTSRGIKLSMFSLHSQDGAAMLWGEGDVGGWRHMEREASILVERGRERWEDGGELQNGSFCIINKTWPIWIAVFVCQPDYLISDTPSHPLFSLTPPFSVRQPPLPALVNMLWRKLEIHVSDCKTTKEEKKAVMSMDIWGRKRSDW